MDLGCCVFDGVSCWFSWWFCLFVVFGCDLGCLFVCCFFGLGVVVVV